MMVHCEINLFLNFRCGNYKRTITNTVSTTGQLQLCDIQLQLKLHYSCMQLEYNYSNTA